MITQSGNSRHSAGWVALAKRDVQRIRDAVPQRASGLLHVWIALLEEANAAGGLTFALERGKLAARVCLSRRMVNYHVEDLKTAGLLAYRAAPRGADGRQQPTTFELFPSVSPVSQGQPIARGKPQGQPVARTSVAQSYKKQEENKGNCTNPDRPLPRGVIRVSAEALWK